MTLPADDVRGPAGALFDQEHAPEESAAEALARLWRSAVQPPVARPPAPPPPPPLIGETALDPEPATGEGELGAVEHQDPVADPNPAGERARATDEAVVGGATPLVTASAPLGVAGAAEAPALAEADPPFLAAMAPPTAEPSPELETMPLAPPPEPVMDVAGAPAAAMAAPPLSPAPAATAEGRTLTPAPVTRTHPGARLARDLRAAQRVRSGVLLVVMAVVIGAVVAGVLTVLLFLAGLGLSSAVN